MKENSEGNSMKMREREREEKIIGENIKKEGKKKEQRGKNKERKARKREREKPEEFCQAPLPNAPLNLAISSNKETREDVAKISLNELKKAVHHTLGNTHVSFIFNLSVSLLVVC